MRVRLPIPVIIGKEEVLIDTLFHSGSHVTIAGKETIAKLFKGAPINSIKARKLFTANGTPIIVNGLLMRNLKYWGKIYTR